MSDLYADAEALGASLAEGGHREWEGRIDDAILGGATSGEILMRLRAAIREILAIAPSIDATSRARATKLLSDIDRAFG